MMGIRDRFKQHAGNAIARARSDELRDVLGSTAATMETRARALAESEAGRRVNATAVEAASEILQHVEDGDTVKQAAAKATRSQLKPHPPQHGAAASMARLGHLDPEGDRIDQLGCTH